MKKSGKGKITLHTRKGPKEPNGGSISPYTKDGLQWKTADREKSLQYGEQVRKEKMWKILSFS